MKIIRFLISSNILIALAAVSLAMATDAEMAEPSHSHVYLWAIFFATLFDYNLHRYLAESYLPETNQVKKPGLNVKQPHLLKFLILASFAGLIVSLIFVETRFIFLLIPLALLSFLYSALFKGKQKMRVRPPRIPGIKIMLIALVWSSATVFLPVLQSNYNLFSANIMFIFSERFAFIFAIAIPFDIRDMKADKLAGIRTLPVVLGEKSAMLICNSAMGISLITAIFHYLAENMVLLLPGYFISVIFALFCINNTKIRRHPLYYHGILDGSILLHGLLISMNTLLFMYLTLHTIKIPVQ